MAVNLYKPETIRLSDGPDWSIRGLLFGEMLKRAMPILMAHHSDLYHDALLLAEAEVGKEPSSFYWRIREYGTQFSDTALLWNDWTPNTALYRVEVWRHPRHGQWRVTFTRLIREQVPALRAEMLTRSAVSG